MAGRTYIAIDLKSFYASVECVERGLDPLTTNLVVADISRTEKTICLAVSPSLKALGIPGRARLFEVAEKVREENIRRRSHAPGRTLAGSSWDGEALRRNLSLGVDYITARPQMALYMRRSAEIYDIYLRYAAPEDIHVYSVDEVFMDVTDYLGGETPRAFARRVVRHVQEATGIPAVAGIGTNLYLCKVALDIMAKHVQADEDGIRVAELDESSYRRLLWDHRPLTDFWRVGRGYARRLEAMGLCTMGDVAACSRGNEDLLYAQFGVNAELLIDHAWGWEPCTMADIKGYRPASRSVSVGQVLQRAYDAAKARIVLREMADSLALDLLEQGLGTDRLTLTVGYDRESLTGPERRGTYRGPVTEDYYGRAVPKQARGTESLGERTSSARRITEGFLRLYDRVVDPRLLVRRMYVVADRIGPEGEGPEEICEQLDLFTDWEAVRRERQARAAARARERARQEAVLEVRRRYGKNAVFRGTSLEEGATGRQRNGQIGGHRA